RSDGGDMPFGQAVARSAKDGDLPTLDDEKVSRSLAFDQQWLARMHFDELGDFCHPRPGLGVERTQRAEGPAGRLGMVAGAAAVLGARAVARLGLEEGGRAHRSCSPAFSNGCRAWARRRLRATRSYSGRV